MQRVIGVSFDSRSMQASLIERRLGAVRHLKSEDYQIPDIPEKRQEFLSETFTKFKKDYSPDGVVIGLTFDHFSHHIVELPLTKKGEIKNALSYELEKHLPLPVDEYMFDFTILSKAPDRTKVLVLSIKKDILKSFIDPVYSAGLDILSVRCSTIEACNNFLTNNKAKNLRCLFIYVSGSFYEIVGLKDAVPVLLRNIRKDKDIILEIEGLLPSFPDGVFMSGKTESSVIEKMNIKLFPLSLANTIAMSALKSKPFSFHFLPIEFSRKKTDYYPYLLGGTAAATVVFFLLTSPLAYYKEQRVLRHIEEKINSIKKHGAGLLELKKKLESIQMDRKFLFDFKNKRNLPLRIMRGLSIVLPKNTWITNLSVDDKGRVEIEGYTKKASELVLALENTKSFKNVYLTEPITAEEKFSLKMEFEEL